MSPATPIIAADLAATCNLSYVRDRLGKRGWGDQRTCTLVQSLVDGRGFPAPFPELTGPRAGRQLTDAVRPGSTWQRAAVDHWFGDFLPPATADALELRQAQLAAAAMDSNAGTLKLVGGTEA